MAEVLVIGSGGREHALVSKLSLSTKVHMVTVCPGNAGTAAIANAQNKALNIKDHEAVVKACEEWGISLVVIGPEDPLADGLADSLRKADIKVFGPSQKAAQLESSKAWSKEFMKRNSIPTAEFEVFSDSEKALKFLDNCKWPGYAIKASGLAGGKGVVVVDDRGTAKHVIESSKSTGGTKLREAFETMVIEEKLEGYEVSVLAFCDGTNIQVMPPAQDHKQRYCGGAGPNTGGMGAYAPCPLVSDEDLEKIKTDVLQKSVDKMKEEGYPYVGVLYAGIMMTANGPKVLEFNCRFGDPETQVLMMLFEGDLYDVMMACATGNLQQTNVAFNKDLYAVTVSVVIESYPGDVQKGLGLRIDGLETCGNEDKNEVELFLAGVKIDANSSNLLTSGGRVVSVSAKAKCLETATTKALKRAARISFHDAPSGYKADFRKDIAFQAIKRIREKKYSLLSYKEAGVNIEGGNEFVKNISKFTSKTKTSGVLGNLGMFGAMFDTKLMGYKDPILVSGTDGVGTKLKIAIEMGSHKTVGEDLVAMCVNDILVHGAEPLFFLDYLACGKLESSSKLDVVEGIASGCVKAGCALVGGETAEMPGMYQKSDYDLAGFAVGAIEREFVLPKITEMKSGNVLIGLSSSGLHSNGFSLVRKMINVSSLSLNQPAPFNPSETLGNELLKPTFIYTPFLKLLRSGRVLGAAHITGGGIEENLLRILPDNLRAQIDRRWKIPSVFAWLAALGINSEEMLRTFNLGLGLILVVKSEDVAAILEDIKIIFKTSFDTTNPKIMPTYTENLSEEESSLCCVIGSLQERKTGEKRCEIRSIQDNLVQTGAVLAHCFPDSVQLGSRKRVAVLISGSGTNLQALLDHTLSGPSAAEIVLVISNVAGVEGLNRASRVGVQTMVISHKEFGTRDEFDQEVNRTLERHAIDLVFLAGFMRILTGKFVRQWLGRMINIHPSLLPSFKGKDAQKQALEAKVCVTGCSVHFVVEEVDAGAIIAQEAVPVMPSDTVASLTDRIKEAEHITFPRALELVARNKVFLNSKGEVERT